ncbi:hypothetical protein BDV19DRAFT_369048 [Aspergillus venezuelensis]
MRQNDPPRPPRLLRIAQQLLRIPMTRALIQENLEVPYLPIEELIARDARVPIAELTRYGFFYPKGYTHAGNTYLHHAVVNNARRVAKFLLSRYPAAILLQPTEVEDAIKPAADDNHLALFAEHS